MKPREKMLAIAVGAVVVLFGLKWGYDTVSQWFVDGEKKIAERTAEKDKAEAKVRAGREAERSMANLQQRSLPANSGQTNYQLWLISVANKDLKNVLVDRGNVSSEKGATARGIVAAKDAK